MSLGRIRAEIEKLVLYAAGESMISASHVRDLVLQQNEPGEQFALMDAIREGNTAGAPQFLLERLLVEICGR